MKNKKKQKLSFRIIRISVLVLVLVFAAIFVSIGMITYNNEKKALTSLSKSQNENLAKTIQDRHQRNVQSLMDLKARLQASMQAPDPSRDDVYQMLQDAIHANELIFGIAACFEPNAFDGKDSQFANTLNHDATGRVIPYVFRNGENYDMTPLVDYDKEESTWYSVPKKTNQMVVTEPFFYPVNGKDVMMYTLALPLQDKNGNFIGIISIDTDISDLQKDVGSYANEGKYVIIQSSSGTFVAHSKNADMLMKNVVQLDPTKADQVKEQASGKEIVDEQKSLSTGALSLRVFSPISFDGTNTFWSVGSIVDLTKVTNNFLRDYLVVFINGLVALVLVIAILWLFMRISVNKPIAKLVDAARRIEQGDVDVTVAFRTNDEFSELASAFTSVGTNLKNLIGQMKNLTSATSQGQFDARIDPAQFGGGYRDIIVGVNGTLDTVVNKVFWYESLLDSIPNPITVTDINMNWTFVNKPVLEMLKTTREQLMGKQCSNWNANICKTEHCGVARLRNGSTETLFEQFGRNFHVTTSYLTNLQGEKIGHIELVHDITKDSRKTQYQNDAVKNLAASLEKLAQGNLDLDVTVAAADEYTQQDRENFLRISESLQTARDNLASYIGETATVLDQVAGGNLDVSVTSDFKGEFVQIKSSMNKIIDALNDMLAQINQASNQVLSGSGQVASASQALSQGSTEQASSIEELSATIEDISTQIKKTADNAQNAQAIAVDSAKTIEALNRQMDTMMGAMGNISESSQKISKIIKAIDEIAFQTNILALNAAVEAARAGEAGKGFAVVADEVRNLASKSADAAKDTAALIESSIAAVEEGTHIAGETAKTLAVIVSEATKSGKIIGEISEASKLQAMAISQTTQGVSQISAVVQTNSATAEESAAASEELSGQASMLNELVERFRLRDTEREGKPQPSKPTAAKQAKSHENFFSTSKY